MTARSPITTHVLDTARGFPAVGIAVNLDVMESGGQWRNIGAGTTDAAGRLNTLLADSVPLARGRYRLIFATEAYFAALSLPAFYPQIVVEFEVAATDEHYHVPLLISPYGYSTYRGT